MSDERDLTGLTCEVEVADGGRMVSFHRCRRPAKGFGPDRFASTNDIPMCGIHLAAQRRRAANDAKRRAFADADAERHAAATALAATLPEWLTPHATPDWSSLASTYTGKVRLTLDADTLGYLAAVLDAAREPQ